ncbi:MAG: thiamine-phosphate kinase [Rubrivivax sp.]|nr:thiamine-phosphate kinase [Rubrivivax sp.]
MSEFDLIARHFMRPVRHAVLGGGDDCALLALRPGMELAVSCDMLVEGRHFVSTVPPERLGHKALAINLSDLAACGAAPLAFTLALTLPRIDAAWLDAFARGLWSLADAHAIDLVGGDTTGGPLAICITVFGEVPPGQALLRSGAQAGDRLWVSHPEGSGIGDARLALEGFRGSVALDSGAFESLRQRMETPAPRNALGVALRGVATSAIDLSDGLIGDLGHVLARSRVGATVDADAMPTSPLLAAQPLALRRECTLAGGDDYELLFTAPASHDDAVRTAAAQGGVAVTCIGHIDAEPGLRIVDAAGTPLIGRWAGFDHFRE